MMKLTAILEGKRYQSPLAAGALFVAKDTGKCLVGLRSKRCDSPHTWGPFGGSIEDGETIKEGLWRELREEIGYSGDAELIESWVFERKNFKYHTFIALVDEEFTPTINDETDEYKWITLEELVNLEDKHHGFAQYVTNAKEQLQEYMGEETLSEDISGKKHVYHGTPDSRFAVTKNSLMGQNSDDLTTGDKGVIWFTDNYHTAKSYADPQRAWDYQEATPEVLKRFIKCKNPLIVDAKGALWRKMDLNVNGTVIKGTRELVAYAKTNGYDGIMVKNVYDNYNHFKGEAGKKKYLANTYAVFDDSQVSHNSHD